MTTGELPSVLVPNDWLLFTVSESIATTTDIMMFSIGLATIIYGFFALTAIMIIALALPDVPIMALAFDSATASSSEHGRSG